MTATDDLRAMLDERGVEYEGNKDVTRFFGYDGFEIVMQEDIDGKLDCLTPLYLTPEQAVEATLGSDLEAENEKLRERIKELEECIRGDAEGIYRLAKNTGYLHTDELMKSINNRMRELGVEVDA